MFTLSTKTTFPKPDSKALKQPELNLKFCSAVLPGSPDNVKELWGDLVPEFDLPPDTKKIFLANTYIINDLVPPDDPSLSPREKRLKTKRTGVLQRTIHYFAKSVKGTTKEPVIKTTTFDISV